MSEIDKVREKSHFTTRDFFLVVYLVYSYVVELYHADNKGKN